MFATLPSMNESPRRLSSDGGGRGRRMMRMPSCAICRLFQKAKLALPGIEFLRFKVEFRCRVHNQVTYH
jgi:hypothetical protein